MIFYALNKNLSIFFILTGLPTGLPEIDLRPPIREKTDVSMGAKTAPTKCSLPLGLIVLRNKFQSNLMFTVEIIKSNLRQVNRLLSVEEIIFNPKVMSAYATLFSQTEIQ